MLAAAFAIAALGSPPANGYVRYKTGSGAPFGWTTSCVRLTAFPTAVANLTKAQTADAITAAVAAWSKQDPALAACSYLDLQLTVAPDGSTMPPARNDGMNTIGFRQDGWCSRADPQTCYDPVALALTTVYARTNGAIVDADVEINAVAYTWADLAAGPSGAARDLQAALTHEIGHVLGLDHSCYITGTGSIPTDQSGNPIPDCADASTAVRQTTMYPTSATDIGPRTLAPDDQLAVCGSYPLASDPMACPAPTTADAGSDGAPMDATTADGSPTDDAAADASSMDAAPADAAAADAAPTDAAGADAPSDGGTPTSDGAPPDAGKREKTNSGCACEAGVGDRPSPLAGLIVLGAACFRRVRRARRP